MLTEDDIRRQRQLNEQEHFEGLYGPQFPKILDELVGDCALTLEDLIKAIKAHLPNVYKGRDQAIGESMARRLDSVLDFDLIPVHYNTLDYIGGVAIMAAEGEPDVDQLRKVELICSSYQNDDCYPGANTVNSELR